MNSISNLLLRFSALLPIFFLLIIIIIMPRNAPAQEDTAEEIMKAVLSSFSLPLRDLLEKESPSEAENLFSGFSGNITFSLPLRKELPADRQGTDTQGEKGRNMSLNASLRYNPLSYWFIESTFFKYWESEYQAPWDPDFTYSFGYDDWHPYTLSLVYSNYGGNRLHPDKEKGEHFTRFEEGTFSLGWKYTLPRWMEELFIVHSSGGIRGSVNWNLTPRYPDASGSAEEWKQSFSLSMKYTIYECWYFDVNVFWYPQSGQQQPWDPDYTYGFGFFDWHPGSFSLQYNNYSGNRFDSGDRAENTGKFRDGAITASWSWAW